MTTDGYQLSYRDFLAYLERWRPGNAGTTLTSHQEGTQAAAEYFYRRFVRCAGRPVPSVALLPVSRRCDPSTFRDPEHWHAVFQNIARRKRPGPVGAAADDAIEVSIDPHGVPPDDHVHVGEIADRVLDAILHRFDTSVAYGPEIQQAMALAVADIVAGSPGAFEDEVNANLLTILPVALDRGEVGRKRRSRAMRRVRRFLAELDLDP